MTSSLVGSEMCIRDRSFTICTAVCVGSIMHVDLVARLLPPLDVLSQETHCLLYTSDAADDM
eukprot:3932961-Prorocentrum_lima.AAC.1